MIDELINKFADYCACDEYHYGVIDGRPGNHDPNDGHMDFDEEKLKTAIYEIGLEVIGADEDPKMEYKRRRVGINRRYLNPTQTVHNPRITVRNELKASQRKAWAKACGVAEK